jgi:neutral ceramidase
MRFCILKDKITPDFPVFQQGFIGRGHKSEGIHDDIFVKVVLMQANKTVLIISLDLCTGDRSFVNGVKKELGEKFGFKEDEVLINFTHTHSAVSISGNTSTEMRAGYSISQENWESEKKDFSQDISYYFVVKAKIIRLAQQCFENLEEGSLLIGRGTSDIGVNRRLMTPEGIKMLPNFNAEYDQDLFVLKLIDKKGNIKGVMFSYGCHPTSLSFDKYLISAEWCGFACSHLEKKYSDAIAVFLQACAGDVKPKASADNGKFKSCSFDETEEIGVEIAKDIIKIMEEQIHSEINLDIKTYLKDVKLYSEILPVTEFERMLQNPSTHESNKKLILKVIDSIKTGTPKQNIQLLISIWSLGDEVKIIGLEGEILNLIGRRIKDIFNDGKTIVLGYSNGIQCYIPNREALEEGGYEKDSFLRLGLCGPFISEAENIIYGQIATAKLC